MNVYELLARLERVQAAPGGWTAGCPAGDHRRTSLLVDQVPEPDGRVLVSCSAGCRTEEIASALGLEMNDVCRFPPDDLETRAINAALKAANRLDDSFDRVEREGIATIGLWPHQAALYTLAMEEVGKEAARNLANLWWVPDWCELEERAEERDPASWLFVGDVKHWPRVIQRQPTLSAIAVWPWLSPDGLRQAATCLELLIRAEVLERGGTVVGGPWFRLAGWVWDSLRTVAYHVVEGVVDEATGYTVWRRQDAEGTTRGERADHGDEPSAER
jgi:hypothetical protein